MRPPTSATLIGPDQPFQRQGPFETSNQCNRSLKVLPTKTQQGRSGGERISAAVHTWSLTQSESLSG
jgi:hypothetical protein